MASKEIESETIFGTTKIQLRFRLRNQIIVGDFREVKGTLWRFIFDM